ncbi:MAG: ATP-dependent helicase HrpB [Candidatus Kapabacteria bacterium]|nr:ATP-dependent helicase HrpB [Candidatus Kapabacteria bacterium]
MPALPVADVIPDVLRALEATSTCILEAPPGAGKTTLVPLALPGRIVMLEPRRLAARNAARRMAALLGEEVGQTVGYRMRMDTRVGPTTRIEVVTEGILARRLVHDPELKGTDIVIFDEFHERSMHADMGLGLCLLSRQLARPDLQILVMSATLSSLPTLPSFLGTDGADAPVVRSHGRMFPVDISWSPRASHMPVPERMADAVRTALTVHEGDVLCFLPGAAEIRRTAALLDAAALDASVDVLPLFGEMSSEAQDTAILPARSGRRKVVLATSIAETSLTIDGIRIVIDGGQSREPRFDARTGMQRLVTVPVSADAAEQRAGRAGRTAPGVCMRLWTRPEHELLTARRTPEILVADLAPLVLDLAAYGADVHDVAWIDAPPPAALEQATALLRDLHAVDDGGIITDHGRRMAAMGVHPRIAHALAVADTFGIDAATATAVAALLGERDILRNTREVDLLRRLHALAGAADDAADRRACGAARERWQHLRRNHGAAAIAMQKAALCVALAYPDRLAKRRDGNRYVLRNGRTAALPNDDPLEGSTWLAVADVDGATELTIRSAAVIDDADVRRLVAHDMRTVEELVDDATSDLVTIRRRTYVGAIVLDERDVANADPDVIATALGERLRRNDYRDLPWTDAARSFQHRAAFAGVDCHITPHRLAPYLHGMRRVRDVQRLVMIDLLRSWCTYQQLQTIDTLAPTHLTLPNGRKATIEYSDAERPSVASKLQDFFGMHDTPRIGAERIPLTIILLSPAGRPVQVTQDLAGFWNGSYADVRKELRGRYPKHAWPEKPA